MNAMRICSVCSKPLAANAPQGLCPECLLKAGLGTGVDIGPDSQNPAESGKVPFVAPTPDELAKPFPQLEILGFIGQGGMGAVYKARQKALDRVVALKILPPGIGKDPAFAERFTREARALARLNHPGIVTLYEFGQADGLFFFLMEFVDGVNLRQLLEAGRLSPREALAIVPQICDALQYAHDQGIVHRDIKPENILLDRQGRVKVADFGLAKLVGTEGESSADGGVAAGSVVLTEAGKVMGTPQYMAPEQMGTPATVDHRADIYSLGVVFYQMLTGELPGKRIEPPSRKVQVDVRIDEIVLRALEKIPELRYQTAADFRTQIETVVNEAGAAGPTNRTDNSAPRLLKGGTSLVTTPEQLGTFDGQFFLYRRKSQMLLEDRQLTFARGGTTTVIPLAAIRDLSIGHYPRTMHPAGLDFISVTYDDGGQTKRLFFSPYESWFGLPSHFNQFVAEWFAAIRAAVVAATGREPGNTPAEQLGVPSGSKVIYALLLAPVILCGTFLLAGVLAGVVMRLRAGDAATHSFLGALLATILGVLGFGFLALALRRLFGGGPKPAMPTPPAETGPAATSGRLRAALIVGVLVWLFVTGTVTLITWIRPESWKVVAVINCPHSNAGRPVKEHFKFTATMIELIRSDAILGRVIDRLQLDERSGKLDERWGKRNLGLKLTKAQAMVLLKRRLDVRSAGGALIQVGVFGKRPEEPEEAMDIANTIAEELRAFRIEQHESPADMLEMTLRYTAPDILLGIAAGFVLGLLAGGLVLWRGFLRRGSQASQVKTAVETIAQSCPPAETSPQPADWRTWSPFQSPQVREICDHMTEAERREWTLRGALFGIWNAATFFVPWGIAFFAPKPLNWIFAPIVLVVGLGFYPLWRRITREFLASTRWARQQGIAPESLRMSPNIVMVGRRGDQAVIHWPGVLLVFMLVLAIAEAVAIFGSWVLMERIDVVPVGIVFAFAMMLMAILIGRGRATPVEQLTPLDGPGGTALKPAGRKWPLPLVGLRNGQRVIHWPGLLVFAGLIVAVAVVVSLFFYWLLPVKGYAPHPRGVVVGLVVGFFLMAVKLRQSWTTPIERLPRLDAPERSHAVWPWIVAAVVVALLVSVALFTGFVFWRFTAKVEAVRQESPNRVLEVRCEGRKAYIQAELDDRHELRLFIGSDELGWSSQYTGSTSVTATVEASSQIKMEDGSLGRGFIFQVKGTRHYIAITPDGPVPFGELVFREDANVTENEGTFTFADIRQSDGTLIPVSIRVRPRPAAAGVSSDSAAQIARLKLEQAQAALVRAKASYDAGTASLTEYQTARLAKDIAEAELSGDTAAILRAKLQFAQEQLLHAESRFEAGWATQAEIEKAKLAKDLAEAQLSGDATAIARTELQSAQQEFLEVEARYKAGAATQAEFEKAKAARDMAQAELGTVAEPPKLRFLAWQDENPTWRDWKAWRPNGERADTKEEQGLLLQHLPARIDLSATKEGRGVRVLFVWFSHPDIQRCSYAEMTMADSTGRTISPCLDGYGGGIYPSKASEGELGWVVRWFAPPRDATLPSTVNLTLRYSLGDWQFPLMVTREVFGGTMQTEWGDIPGAGETLDGKAFVSLVRNTTKGRDLHVDFAAETMDGRLIEPSGTLASGPPEMRHERFEFDPPLGQIKEFRLRTCPIRTVEYRNVSLQAGHSAEVQVSPVSSSQPAAFGPVIERVIATPDADDQGLVFFDVETGKSFKPPFSLTFHPNHGPAFVELTPELKQWIKARDMDILLHLGETNWDMMTLGMQEEFAGQLNEWETISPEKVIGIFAKKDAEHLVRDEVAASSFGHNYADEFGSFNAVWPPSSSSGLKMPFKAFRTRSNTMGVYQFRGLGNTNRRGVGIRYKLVQAAGSASTAPPQANASKTFSLHHMLASEMADDLRQILLGRFGMEATPAPDNMQLTVTAPPDVLNRVSTLITVADWPNRIAPGPDSYYPRENVELAARSFFYACSIEDTEGVALMLSPGVLAELRGTSLTAHGVLGEEKDAKLVRQLRGNWPGKEAAVQGVIQAWNRFPLQRLWAEPGVAIGFGIRYFATAWFEGAPEERTQLSFIPDRTGGTNGPLMIDTLPP